MNSYQGETRCRFLGTPGLRLAVAGALAAGFATMLARGAEAPKKPVPAPVPAPAPAAKPAPQQPTSIYNLNNSPLQHNVTNNPFQKLTPGNSAPHPTANYATQKFIPGAPVASRTFPGHPAPPGSSETPGRNGAVVRKSADGAILDVHNPHTGMSVHHALDGSRQISVEKPDHSRVYIPARGIQYVQHPYQYQGHAMINRTLVVNGQTFHQIYRPYTNGNTRLDVYATTRYFAPNFYQWAQTPFKGRQNFAWTYTSNSSPWYGHYRGYFTPEPAYDTPALYLTDYMLAATLYVAYATQDQAGEPAPANAAPVTPAVKKALADEVSRQISSEAAEAQENARNVEPSAASGAVTQTLSDHQLHAFVVASALDLVDSTGRRCSLSDGDVVNVSAALSTDSSTVGAIVLSSKGGAECGPSAQVQVALEDAQEMQNHMRETLEQGLANTKAAEQAQSVTPAFAAAAPAADPNAANEIRQQEQIAAATEG